MKKKVLVIDDDLDYVEAVKTLLEAKGYEVNSAENGEDGINMARKVNPDLILLDVMMTDKTEGFKISREFKEDEKLRDIPIVIVSGIRKDMNIPFRFDPDETWLPVKEVIEKPVKPDLLLEIVARYTMLNRDL